MAGALKPAHERYPPYPQAEPPGPVTCTVYLLVALFFVGAIVFIVLKATGVL